MIQLKVWLLRAEERKAQLIFQTFRVDLTTIEFDWEIKRGGQLIFLLSYEYLWEQSFEVGRHSFLKSSLLSGDDFIIDGGMGMGMFFGIFNCHEMYTFFFQTFILSYAKRNYELDCLFFFKLIRFIMFWENTQLYGLFLW